MKKIQYIYRTESYSVFKKQSKFWYNLDMNFEDIRLSKVSQSAKDKYCMIPFI